jgi:hypothetical protein
MAQVPSKLGTEMKYEVHFPLFLSESSRQTEHRHGRKNVAAEVLQTWL